ncbi:hypothetical protein [Nonomuraea helvata]|uniref:Uncharacterized protein n=1 Tax=Nonomuraea helvata TaxID=37484 RepID=A0ABV5SAU6_9ACTN
MSWIPLFSTALGAVIGIAATLLADWTRANRNQREESRTVRRQLYGDYLAALSLTRHHLRVAARNAGSPIEDKARLALEAFEAGGAYQARYQVALVAPGHVTDASTAAFNALRSLRDLIEGGGGANSDPAFREAQQQWAARFAALRNCMRVDLGLDQGEKQP